MSPRVHWFAEPHEMPGSKVSTLLKLVIYNGLSGRHHCHAVGILCLRLGCRLEALPLRLQTCGVPCLIPILAMSDLKGTFWQLICRGQNLPFVQSASAFYPISVCLSELFPSVIGLDGYTGQIWDHMLSSILDLSLLRLRNHTEPSVLHQEHLHKHDNLSTGSAFSIEP